MAGTVNYLFDPNQDIFTIIECPVHQTLTVSKGKIIRIRTITIVGSTDIVYDVRLENASGITELNESDIFVDVATVITEYQLRITA